jgi:hypothetical protein
MPNTIYDRARVQLLTAQLDWRTIPLVLTAWSGTPAFNPLHQIIADIVAASGVELGHSMEITEQSVSADGTAQTNEVVVPGVPVGSMVTWFTMAWLNATYAQSSLILFIDDAEGLPFDPNGLDMLVTPDWLENRGWWRP